MMEKNESKYDSKIFVLLLMFILYRHYWGYFEERLHDPFFIVFLIALLILLFMLYFYIGHHIEKVLNQFQMWRHGVKSNSKLKGLAFTFKPFDLPNYLKDFYKDNAHSEETFIGLDAEQNNKTIVSIPDIQRSQHLQVLGMTGTGKTAGIFLPLIYQDALKNRPVIILDAKGELSSINQLNAMLESIGRSDDFMLFSLVHKDKSCTYNPLHVGECDPQIIIDAFFNNFKDDNSFFRETAKTIFTNTFYILHSLGKPFTPMDVYTYLTNKHSREYVDQQITPTNEKGTLHLRLLETLTEQLTEQYKGWEHVVTGFNNYLLAYRDNILNDDDSDIVLTDVIRQRKIVYFQLPTNAYPIQAVSIAKMVQANLRYISSLIQIGQIPKDILVSVIIDEYASFAEESFVEVLNKARSSGMMVTLAHQSLSDLKAISDTFMKRIDENTLNKIYLKQTDPELCELIAKSMGTFTKEEKTYQMTGGAFGNQINSGNSSNKVVNEFYFPPDKVKNLYRFGQGYLIYRGDNSQKCVNFGCFKDIRELPYQKRFKKNKQQGLLLFEQFYLNASSDVPILKVINAVKTNGKIAADE